MPSLSAVRAGLRASVFADLEPSLAAHAARGGDLIGLHLGDTYLEPPQAARIATVVAQEDDGARFYRYANVAGSATFREALADDARRRGRAAPHITGKSHVLLGAGATHAIFCAASAVLSPGDDVLLLAPYWPLAHGILVAVGARPVEVPFSSRLYEDPSIDVASTLREALTPKTKAVYLITPNNPDGKVLSRGELEAIAAFAVAEDLWVFADEAYADFTFGAPHVSIATLPGMAERTLSAYSFSKSYALAGLRVGYVIAPEEVVRVAQRVSTHSIFSVPLAMQEVAAAALASGPRWTERASLLYRRSLEAVVSALRGTGLRFPVPEGGTYVFVDCAEILRGRPLALFLESAVERGVLLAPGVGFGAAYTNHARLCFTSEPLPRLEEGLVRLVAAVNDFRR